MQVSAGTRFGRGVGVAWALGVGLLLVAGQTLRAQAAPEIGVDANGVQIVNGDFTPSVADNTDFGSVPTTDGERTLTFYIRNTGTAPLHLTDVPLVRFSGGDSGDFSVSQSPFTPIASNGFIGFSLRFNPTDLGVRTTKVVILNDDADEGSFEFWIRGTGVAGVGAPEIQVLGGSDVEVANGDGTPELTDGTEFGNVVATAGVRQRYFAIRNTGSADLVLSGDPIVQISGPASADFAVTSQALSPIRAGQGGGCWITFDPATTGLRQATVTIANNDADEAPYSFAIQGTGTVPTLAVSGNGQTIPSGDLVPTADDDTDFGSLTVGGTTRTHTFTVTNAGTAELLLSGSPRIALSGAQAADFAVLQAPSSPLAPTLATPLRIRFRPTGEGLRTALVSIASNDPDTATCTFAIQGTGVADHPLGSISGTLWDDADADGSRDPGETPLAGWTVYLDLDANGVRDGGEPSTLSAADGTYQFAGLAAGPYLVAQELPAGWVQWHPTGQTARVSAATDGTPAEFDANQGELSGSGTAVVFLSSARNLVPGDVNEQRDVFVRDLRTGETELVSVSAEGVQANRGSWRATISDDGRYVAFNCDADNLLPGSQLGMDCVFVLDRRTRTVERVSVASDGTVADSYSSTGTISGNGRYVAFVSWATNLVPGDTNDRSDVFVHDRETGITERVSVATDGTQVESDATNPAISDDGRYVGFTSYSSSLVPGDTNGAEDVFVHDRQTHTTRCASVNLAGQPGNGPSSWLALSGDGRYAAFASGASDLVAGGTTGGGDIFLRDLTTDTTERVSLAADGGQADGHSVRPHLSRDGRYVAFLSAATNLVAGDTNARHDLFVRDRAAGTTTRLNLLPDGSEEDDRFQTYPVRISDPGSVVAFGSDNPSLVPPGDGNWNEDVFTRTWGPFTGTHAVQVEPDGLAQGVDFGSHVETVPLQVSSEPPPEVTITGSHGGRTNYTVRPDKGATVTLVAPDSYSYIHSTYAFQHWTLDGQPQADGETTLAFTATAASTAVAVYAATEAQLSVQSLPSGVAVTGTHPGTTDYVAAVATGTLVEVVAPATHAVGNQDYVLDRWFVNGSPGSAGRTDEGVVLTANTVLLAQYKPTPRSLAVSATVTGDALPGIAIEGTHPGITDYATTAEDNRPVTLTAPTSYTDGTDFYRFLRWKLDGSGQPDGQTTLAFTIQAAATAEAVYEETVESFTLSVSSVWTANVPIAGTKPGVTAYTAPCLDGEVVTLTAPWRTASGHRFVRWEDGGGSLLTYSATLALTISANTQVYASYTANGEFYVNDAVPDEGVAAGDDDHAGTSPAAPMASLQALLNRYPDIGTGCAVYVSAGTYQENVTVGAGHSGLQIAGDGQGRSILDGQGAGSCLTFDAATLVTLTGFTLRHGLAANGGGIRGTNGAAVTVEDCAIVGNEATGDGGGIHFAGGALELSSVLLAGNAAGHGGGAAFAGGADVTLDDVRVAANAASADGGGILATGCTVTAASLSVVGNQADGNGGGIVLNGGSAVLGSLVATGNLAGGSGGALYLDTTEAALARALLTGNVAAGGTGGAVFAGSSTVVLEATTMDGNRATAGGGILVAGGSETTIHNSIVAGNLPNQLACRDDGSANRASFSYSCLQDGPAGIPPVTGSTIIWGNGSRTGDPRFVGGAVGTWTGGVTYDEGTGQSTISDHAAAWAPGHLLGIHLAPDAAVDLRFPVVANTATSLTVLGDLRGLADIGGGYQFHDLHLQSRAGHWTAGGWVLDAVTSPCLDVGDPATPTGDEPAPAGWCVNLGFHGGTVEASKSPAYWTLFVNASGGVIVQVPITGTTPGTTNYIGGALFGQAVELTAPPTTVDSFNATDLSFLRWVLDGVDQANGERTLALNAPDGGSSTAAAVYGPTPRRLTVQSLPVSGIPISGGAGGTTDYALSRDDNSFVSLGAPSAFAAPDGTDYTFSHWLRDGQAQTAGDTTVNFYIQQDTTAVAVYTRTQREIRVRTDFFSQGIAITGSYPGTTNYTANCADNETVTLTAPATATDQNNLIYAFAGWKVNSVLDVGHTVGQTITWTVNDDTTFEPAYAAVVYRVDVRSTPVTGIYIEGVWVTTDSSRDFNAGETLTLTAPATVNDNGTIYQLVRWVRNGEDQEAGQVALQFRLLAATTCVAEYAPVQHQLTVETSPAAAVALTGTPAGTTPYASSRDDNSAVNLTAPATILLNGAEYAFTEWLANGNWKGDNPTVSFFLYEDTALVARYTAVRRTLWVRSSPIGGIDISGTPAGRTDYNGALDDNTAISLTAPATASSGDYDYQFDHWTIGAAVQDQGLATIAFNLKQDITCQAHYVPIPRTVTVQSTPIQQVPIVDLFGDGLGGDTNYSVTVDDETGIQLQAPATVAAPDDTDYTFSCWVVDGVEQSPGATALYRRIGANTLWVAAYQPTERYFQVESTPLTGVAITGTYEGTTNSGWQAAADNSAVSFTAPQLAAANGVDYRFVRWNVNDVPQPLGQRTVAIDLNDDTTFRAEYEIGPHQLSVVASPATPIELTGTPAGTTPYATSLDHDSLVSLTAPATIAFDGADYTFTEWLANGQWIGGDPSIEFPLTADTALTAAYTVVRHTLQVRSSPITGVAIGGVPACTTDYSGELADHTAVSLTAPATASDGDYDYRFDHWLIDSAAQPQGTATIAFPLTQNATCIACYLPVPRTVTVQSTPIQGVTIQDTAGLGLGSVTNYSATVDDNATISLQAPAILAAPDGTDYTLLHWSVDGVEQGLNVAVLGKRIGADTLCVAVYEPTPRYFRVQSTPITGVAVTGTYAGTTNGDWQAAGDNSTVSLTAPAFADNLGVAYAFVRWNVNGGAQADGQRTVEIALNATTTFLAEYVVVQRQLTVQSTPVTGISITGTAEGATNYATPLDDGTTVRLTAPATVTVEALDYAFTGWTLGGISQGANPTLQFVIAGDTTAVARYGRTGATLTVQSSPSGGVPIVGDKPGTTPYGASGALGEQVQLTAPARNVTDTTVGTFVKWTVDGVDAPPGQTVQLVLDADTTAIAVYGEVPLLTLSLTLMSGWNLVSFPIEPLDCALPDVLASPGAPGRGVPPAGVHTDSVCAWIPGEDCHYEPAAEMHALVGYWLYAEADDTAIEIRGTAVAAPALSLAVGWNLVGPVAAISPGDLGVARVFRWNLNPLFYQALAPDEDLLPGFGYWIWADTAGVVPLAP